jgi:hypothetical protein
VEFDKELRHFPIYQCDFIVGHQSVYGKIAVAREEVEGKACLAMLHDTSRDNLQLHDICVYPSLWRTVNNQHQLFMGRQERGKREGPSCEQG